MNRTVKRYFWAVMAVTLGLTFGLGCSPLTTLWFLNDDGKVQAQYKLEPKSGKRELVVAVIVSSVPEISSKPQFATLDRELAYAISSTLVDETAKDKVKVTVIDQSKVERLRSLAPEKFDTVERSELALKLGADYLIQVNLSKFGLYNEGFGRELPQGHAAMMVQVFEAGVNGKTKYDYPFDWQAEQQAMGDVPLTNYYQLFVKELGKRIAQHHVKHKAEREISRFGSVGH